MEQEKIYSKVSVFSLTLIATKFLKDKINIKEYIPEDINDEIIEEVRYYILNKLNKTKEVYDIKDILTEEDEKRFWTYFHTLHVERFNNTLISDEEKYPIFTFKPIMFSYKLPLAIQDELFPREYPNEEFKIIIDGTSIFILGKCPIDRIPSGIPDVRDKIIEILNEPNEIICKIIGLGLRKQFIFLNDMNISSNLDINIYVYSRDENNSDDNLKQLYHVTYYFVNELVDLSEELNEINDYVEKINSIKEEILQNLLQYTSINSWNLYSINTCLSKTEKLLINSFYLYSQFLNKLGLYRKIKKETINRYKSKDILYIKILDDNLIDIYQEPMFDEKLYMDTYSNTYDIIQKYAVNRTTIIAGIIGGLLVFILTGLFNMIPNLISLFLQK